jgi:CD109 antigen
LIFKDNSFLTLSPLKKSGTIVMTDAMKFKAGTLGSTNITTVRRDINYDYTADIQSNIVIPLQPTCSFINLTAQEQLDLQNMTSVRSKFIDTLLWQDVEYTSGMTTLKTTVPDTVTSWALTGYSLSAISGLGILQTPLILTTFKPFFTDVRLPSTCKMGVVADIQVTVHNYLDQTFRVEVTLDDSTGDFDIVPTGRAFSDYVEYDENFEQRNAKLNTFQVVGDGVRSTTFSVKPKKIGPMKLKVQTISKVACDTVEKIVMVEAPGKTIVRTVTQPIFLSPIKTAASSVFEINMPPNAVPGSMKVQLSVQGDKYSLELENQQPVPADDGDVLTTLIAKGTNALGFTGSACQSSNSLVDLANAAINFLKGQCSDGGFRIDGDCDQSLRDTTYTASTLIAIAWSVNYNLTSLDVVTKGFDWLASIQRADGSFPNPIPYPVLFVEGPITTSYVLFSYLNANINLPGIKNKYATTISRALDNLFGQIDSLDILSLAFLCRSAQLNQDARKNVAFNKLSRLSFKNEFTQKWTRSALLDEALRYIFEMYQGEPDLVTMFRVSNGVTQYVVEHFYKMSAALKIQVITGVNNFGTFSSTLTSSSYQMNVSFSSSNSTLPGSSSEVTTVVLDSSNKSLLSTFEMAPNTKVINVMASGSGLALTEMTYEYNLMPEDVVDAYLLKLTLTSAMLKEWQLNVCVSSKLTPNPIASVMEIKFPPGFNTTEYIQDNDAMTQKIKVGNLKDKVEIFWLFFVQYSSCREKT